MSRSIKFSENTKPGAEGKGKENITEENENRLNKQSVNITEKREPIAILSKARADAVEKMIQSDPRFEQDDELSEKIYTRLEK
jgi:hypothetical protein